MAGDGPEFASWRPHPALRPFVDGYLGYHQSDVTLAVHRGLPSRHITLIISLDAPIRIVAGPGAEAGPLRLQTVVGGLHLAPALIAQASHQRGMHLSLNPLGARALLGVSASELAATVVGLADLPGGWGPELTERLVEAPGWRQRFMLVDAALLAALRPATVRTELSWAWRRMIRQSGTGRIAELAGEVGWSRRHFGDRFAREVGVSPKQAARLLRFEHSGQLLRGGGYRNLAEVAARCGFYDQAHMTGEWRVLAGCGPGTWIREELPFLQDEGTDGVADSRYDKTT
ncbi:MAG: helix-turn-helix domain-containing protein [Sciscionella sp.]